MKYLVIDPKAQETRMIHASSFDEAVQDAGLPLHETDHGTVAPGIAIVVGEHSLFVPPDEQDYFEIGRQLFGGPALLYAYDVTTGETLNMNVIPPIRFFRDARAVEHGIALGLVNRPRIAVNKSLLWQWPEKERGEE